MDKSEEFEEKVLYINRCSKVVKGGRTFSFSALVITGNKNGSVGYGFAKANEVSDAIKKASENAKKNIFTFQRKKTTIPHEIKIKYDGATVLLKPAREGTGVVAGSTARAVLELGGVTDIVAKSLGANNPLNVVKATIEGLKYQRNIEEVMGERNVSDT